MVTKSINTGAERNTDNNKDNNLFRTVERVERVAAIAVFSILGSISANLSFSSVMQGPIYTSQDTQPSITRSLDNKSENDNVKDFFTNLKSIQVVYATLQQAGELSTSKGIELGYLREGSILLYNSSTESFLTMNFVIPAYMNSKDLSNSLKGAVNKIYPSGISIASILETKMAIKESQDHYVSYLLLDTAIKIDGQTLPMIMYSNTLTLSELDRHLENVWSLKLDSPLVINRMPITTEISQKSDSESPVILENLTNMLIQQNKIPEFMPNENSKIMLVQKIGNYNIKDTMYAYGYIWYMNEDGKMQSMMWYSDNKEVINYNFPAKDFNDSSYTNDGVKYFIPQKEPGITNLKDYSCMLDLGINGTKVKLILVNNGLSEDLAKVLVNTIFKNSSSFTMDQKRTNEEFNSRSIFEKIGKISGIISEYYEGLLRRS
ncbi:MAG: hypothetical protein ACP5RP_03500 [Candidatus Micrarchaeia archaeon]